MTTSTVLAPASPSARSRVQPATRRANASARALRRVTRAFAAWVSAMRRQHAGHRQLLLLNDHLLRDIGLTRRAADGWSIDLRPMPHERTLRPGADILVLHPTASAAGPPYDVAA